LELGTGLEVPCHGGPLRSWSGESVEVSHARDHRAKGPVNIRASNAPGTRKWLVDVFHFSEDPSIPRFIPHVPRSNPAQAPAVWAIDEAHSPLYWFPRACPRVAAWPRTPIEQVAFSEAFCSTAPRVHAIELRWLTALSTTALYRYRFDAAAFRPWSEASGQWIAHEAIKPLDVERMPDLAQCHVDAEIELRAVPSLWPIRDLACSGPWDFSVVRFTNAGPR
jgi:hypothetical protein